MNGIHQAEKYVEIKKELLAQWKKEKLLSPLLLATHYYFNHNLSYGPGFFRMDVKNLSRKKQILQIIK